MKMTIFSRFHICMTTMCLFLACIVFVSCDGGDGGKANPEQNQGSSSGAIGKLAGTWTKKLGNTGVAGIKFTSNGKFYFNEWGVKEQPNFDNVIVPADYKVSGSTITITHSMEPDYYVKCSYALSNDGNSLTITNISSEYHDLSGTWTRLN